MSGTFAADAWARVVWWLVPWRSCWATSSCCGRASCLVSSGALYASLDAGVTGAGGLRGLNAYAMRVGGAQHLKAHLDPGLSHDALRWAGVWADDAMANYYGGYSIEAFRSHARLMVQPTAVLPQF